MITDFIIVTLGVETEEATGTSYINIYPYVNSIQSQESFSIKNTINQVVETPGNEIYVDTQLPSFVREDHPRFVEFLKAYYLWLDHNQNIGEKIRKLKNEQDIDLASPEYAEHFYKEFLQNIPRNVLTDKKILVKYIKQFYRAKGTEKSYRFFFRMLFNTSVEFYYPSRDILKVSDGKWIQERCLRVIPIVGDLSNFENKKIFGKENGITAFVDSTRKVKSGVYSGYELILNTSSISGKFLPDEVIQTEDGKYLARISPVPTSYEFVYDVDNGKYKTGTGYRIGDTFDILNGTGRGARIKVTSIIPSQQTIQSVVVTAPQQSVLEINLGNKNIVSITKVICANDGGLYQAEPKSEPGIDENEVNHESVKEWYRLSEDASGNAILKLLSSFPTPQGRIRVEYEYSIEDNSGAIENMQIVNFGLEYRTYLDQTKKSFKLQLNQESCVTKSFTGSGAEISLSANTLAIYPGYYANEDGHLSSSKKIQDGEYYQQYSYVIITNQPTEQYRETLKEILHPAGLRFYGEYRQQNLVSSRIKTAGNSLIRREFKQFPHPTRPGFDPPLHSEPHARADISIKAHVIKDRHAASFGPSSYSIFRERFDYKPTEKYNASQEINGINSEYWSDKQILDSNEHIQETWKTIAAVANTSIDKFKDIIPIMLEGVSESDQNSLPHISEYRKTGNYQTHNRGDLIYNTTKRIVELYDGGVWLEINPNKRINMLPDAVVATTGLMVTESGEIVIKLTSVRTMESLGNHKVVVL